MNTITERPSADRALRAYQQSQDYVVYPEPGTETAWGVTNIRTGKGYVVDGDACTCGDFQHRLSQNEQGPKHCKHWHLVQMHVQCEREEQEARDRAARRRRFVLDWDCGN